MNIFPAIDLYEGKAVRLLHGDYHQITVFSDTPADKAAEFRDRGAEYLHVVDLQGARDGIGKNIAVASAIARTPGLRAELGGGIRAEDDIKRALDAGFFRVILGTSAMEEPDFLARMVEKYGPRIAVGVDARDGFVAVRGWLEVSRVECFDFVESLEKMGVSTVICTDISKDGAMKGPNVELYRRLHDRFKPDIVASGGVATLDDVRALRETGAQGVIIGRALYDGTMDLTKAIEVSK